jgi:segregation and condensation protein B
MTAGSPDPPLNLSGEWQLDAEPVEDVGIESGTPEPEPQQQDVAVGTAATVDSPGLSQQADVPPTPEQLIEAMLFVGGHPLTAETAISAIRGLTQERFLVAIDVLTRRYRQQRRPYAVVPGGEGFVLAMLPMYRGLRESLFGGPRETRLSQPALDVLSVVAYRQPVGKAEVDAIRGTDSGSILRQLVRLGLVAVQHRAESGSREVRYGTTPRFLHVFGLASLDELPRLGDTSQV